MADSPGMAPSDTPDVGDRPDREDRPASPVNLTGLSDQEILAVIEEALNRLSAQDLTAVMQAAEEKRRNKQDEVREMLLREFRERAASVGIPFEALLASSGYASRGRRTGTGSINPVLYRGPGGETWTGKGRKPRWIQILESEGRNKEEYRVGDTQPLPPA